MANALYSLRDLQGMTGISARTLRDWIRKRLLPRPIGRGRAARYGDGHLVRVRAIAALRKKRESVRSIRARLSTLSEDQLRALIPPPPPATTADGVLLPPAPPAAPTYPVHTYEVVELMAGLLLMVDTRRGPALRRIVDDIYRHYAMPPQASL